MRATCALTASSTLRWPACSPASESASKAPKKPAPRSRVGAPPRAVCCRPPWLHCLLDIEAGSRRKTPILYRLVPWAGLWSARGNGRTDSSEGADSSLIRGCTAERQTGPQESARSGRPAPLREGASALAEIEPLSEGGVADARSLQR